MLDLPPKSYWAAAIVAAQVAELADAALVQHRGQLDIDHLIADGWRVVDTRIIAGKRVRILEAPDA